MTSNSETAREPTYKKQRREKLRQAKQRPQPRDCTRLDDDGDGHAEQRRIFIYDGNQIVMDFWRTNSGDMQVGHLRQRYLWGPAVDQILAEEAVDGGTPELVQWTLTDHLNTVRDIAKYDPGSDMTTVVNHLIYDAFGKVTSESNPATGDVFYFDNCPFLVWNSLFLFTGRPFDSDTQLQNNLNRWYDARVGRWLSEDPIGFAGGDGNLYRYVGNVPQGAVDPEGNIRVVRDGWGNGQGTPDPTNPQRNSIWIRYKFKWDPLDPGILIQHVRDTGHFDVKYECGGEVCAASLSWEEEYDEAWAAPIVTDFHRLRPNAPAEGLAGVLGGQFKLGGSRTSLVLVFGRKQVCRVLEWNMHVEASFAVALTEGQGRGFIGSGNHSFRSWVSRTPVGAKPEKQVTGFTRFLYPGKRSLGRIDWSQLKTFAVSKEIFTWYWSDGAAGPTMSFEGEGYAMLDSVH